MISEKEINGILGDIAASAKGKVKVAVCDIDGALRGKYIAPSKLASSLKTGLGFCDVVFGWDVNDQTYDNTTITGWHHGYPDITVKLDPSTYRRVPWDDDVAFFLGEFINRDGTAYPVCPRQILKKVLKRASKLGLQINAGIEYEWFNFRETPNSWSEKIGANPEPITPGMFGYSLLRLSQNRDYVNSIWDKLGKFGIPIEGLHTETGPGVFEAAILQSDALEQADRAVLFKSSVKEIASQYGIIPSFMAKWNDKLPGCSGHIHISLSDGSRNLFHDPNREYGMSGLFDSWLAGQLECLMSFAPMFWPTINSYKRLVDGFWAPVKPTWGLDNRTTSFRVISGSETSTRLEVRCPGADSNPYLAMAAVIAAGIYGIENDLQLTTPPVTGNNFGTDDTPRAVRTLSDATKIFKKSDIARDFLGDAFVEHFAETREWEWRQWLDGVTDWERRRYLETI